MFGWWIYKPRQGLGHLWYDRIKSALHVLTHSRKKRNISLNLIFGTKRNTFPLTNDFQKVVNWRYLVYEFFSSLAAFWKDKQSQSKRMTGCTWQVICKQVSVRVSAHTWIWFFNGRPLSSLLWWLLAEGGFCLLLWLSVHASFLRHS